MARTFAAISACLVIALLGSLYSPSLHRACRPALAVPRQPDPGCPTPVPTTPQKGLLTPEEADQAGDELLTTSEAVLLPLFLSGAAGNAPASRRVVPIGFGHAPLYLSLLTLLI